MSGTTYDYKAIHVRESTKITELCDALNNLRYKVILKPIQVIDTYDNLVTAYTINVISYFYGDEGIQVVPASGEPRIIIFEYDEAIKRYNKYVIDYKALLKAQTRDIQDIDIYREKIDYKDTCPKCCATCNWCKRFTSKDDIIFGREGKFECWNPANEKEFDFDYKDPNLPRSNPLFNNPSHFFGELPPIRSMILDKANELKIHPIVSPLGLCKRYEVVSAKPEPRPVIGESINHMINRKIDFKLSGSISSIIAPEVSTIITPVISTEIISNLSTTLSSELSVPVIQAVTMVLSSTEASVALSAPVVNLVTNSQVIHTQTINVIGDALSSGVMHQPMICAVADVLSASEISAAMIDPVSNIIPSNEVSGIVADTAAKGITIEKIIGNKGEPFKDLNNDDIPDEYQDTLIIGSLEE